MTREEKIEQLERMLVNLPEIMSPLKVSKTEAFRRIFEQKKGKPWVEQRKAAAFNGKFIIPTKGESKGQDSAIYPCCRISRQVV